MYTGVPAHSLPLLAFRSAAGIVIYTLLLVANNTTCCYAVSAAGTYLHTSTCLPADEIGQQRRIPYDAAIIIITKRFTCRRA